MKGLNGSILRAAAAVIIGLVLVLFPEQASEYLVITIGIIFMVPSLIGIIGYFASDKDVRPRFPIEGIGSLLFGLWLVVMPGFFADLLTVVFGLFLLAGAICQIASLCITRRYMPVSVAFFIVPVLILIAGLLALFNPTGTRATALIVIGIGSLVYALSELVNYFRFIRRRKSIIEKMKAKASETDIEEAEVVDE